MADVLQAVIGVLEDAANRLLRLDPDSLRELGGISGRVIRLDLRGLGRPLYLFPSEAGIYIRTEHAGAPDAILSARFAGLLNLALGRQSRAFLSGELEISGDIDLGQRFQKILRQFDIDWEEAAARWLGDPLAHQLGNFMRAASSGLRASGEVVMRDLVEYLQYERRDLPQRHEVDDFLRAVDVLRADVDRMERRIARLAHGAGPGRGVG